MYYIALACAAAVCELEADEADGRTPPLPSAPNKIPPLSSTCSKAAAAAAPA
jgi:hypothetical protein